MMIIKQMNNLYQMEMASTGIKGLDKRPVTTTSNIKYQNSKLIKPNNYMEIKCQFIISQKAFLKTVGID